MTCAFRGCLEEAYPPETCTMVGGCIERRFGRALTRQDRDELRKDARALVGTKPARTNRDPALIKRRRRKL